MSTIYDKREKTALMFIAVSVVLVAVFLYFSHKLVRELSTEERAKVEIWAEAMRILSTETGEGEIPLILKVLQSNHTIPVLLVDEQDSILTYKNVEISRTDSAIFLRNWLVKLKQKDNKIVIPLSENSNQYLYYDDSTLLKKLSYYPYIQLSVMAVFLIIVYFAVSSTKKAEQNQLWVGLSKETAHQLGTPISSLMGWIEILKMKSVDPTLLQDMGKDVNRLSIIAERFSKIGSKPEIVPVDIVPALSNAIAYMSKRTSARVIIKTDLPNEAVVVALCVPLFEWVIENLCKNAIDAMNGEGNINLSLTTDAQGIAHIEIADTGKGIPKSKFKTIFRPGYTTKSRGWGLGLTLVKRIVEEYHEGKIYVKASEINKGTIFKIELKTII